ncbi:protein angel homolog 2 [Paramormyrops kingsleyae]|uniref:protein angel homolog 2 n=1 Tax=Paramormyrops kingsleyae TaxID=1676925 RepID=UPI003B9753E3
MFTRYLNTVGLNFTPTPGFLGHWRTLRSPTLSGWMCRAPWPNPRNYLSVNIRPPDVCLRVGWRQTPFSSCSRKSFQLSCAHMDRADKEPPLKRMRSADRRSASPTRQSRACSSPPPPMRGAVATSPDCANRPSPECTWTKTRKTVPTEVIKRQWKDFSYHYRHTSSSQAGQDPPFDFSVMSYNILSQDLLQDNAYLYRHCQLPVLDWSHRLPSLLRELQQHSADILCLQEVQEDHYLKQIKPSLDSLGYHSEYKRRTGRKPDGCAVCFKRDRFSLVSCHPVEFYRRGVPLLDRDNVGLVLLLRPSGVAPSSGRGLCVANTHLLYNPRRGDIKLAQLALLLAEISRVSRPLGAADDTPCPVILCGDFNSVPWSPLYTFIRDSRLEYEGIPIGKVSGQEQSPRGQRILTTPIWPPSLGINQRCQYETASCRTAGVGGDMSSLDVRDHEEDVPEILDRGRLPRIEHGLQLTSAYSHYLEDGRRPEITTCHSRTAITVDYIFYSAAQGDVYTQPECSRTSKHGLHLLGRLALLGETDLWMANGLPNEHNSSDHLPLLVRFRLCY